MHLKIKNLTGRLNRQGITPLLSGKFYLVFLFLCGFTFYANAQAQSTTGNAVTTATKPPVANNMEAYKKTPQYTKRKAKLDKATPAAQSKDVKFQDGTVLHVKLDKSAPEVLGGPVQHKVGKEKKESSGGYDCTTNTVNLTATSTDFLNNDYSGSTANIYPGACYTYAHLTDGSWQQQTGARNPVQITTDNPNIRGNSYVNVANPSAGTLETAVANLFSRMSRSTSNESLTYQVSDAVNSATYNLQVGAAASGYGVDLSNVYSTANQSNHVHLTIDATKTLFTISTTPPDSGFFTDPSIEATPYLSFIGEVSYGVRVLANADITFNSQQEADQFKASYSGYGVSVSLNVDYGSGSKSTNTTINAYTIGGPGNQVVAYSLDELKKQIEKAFAGASYQNARPIKYKAYSMSGDCLNTYSATDNFDVRSCIPADGGSPELKDVSVTFTQGNDGKEPATGYYVKLYPGLNPNINNPGEAMFTYLCEPFSNTPYGNNSTITVVLQRNKFYKGAFDETAFQKNGGGTLIVGPLMYKPNATGGVSIDLWKIDGIKMVVNLKPTSADPNPPIPGGNNGISWTLSGPNEVVLNSNSLNTSTAFFSNNFISTGNQ